MTYNVFGGTLSLTQSINQSSTVGRRKAVQSCRHVRCLRQSLRFTTRLTFRVVRCPEYFDYDSRM